MKTPPWKSAPPAGTGASAMNAPHFRHARSDLSHDEHDERITTTPGGADRADRCRVFNVSNQPRHAATGDGLQRGAHQRDNSACKPFATDGEAFGLIHELQILAAIAAFPSVLARFKALGVVPGIFAWPAIALLARFVMTWDRPDPPPVLQEHADAMLDPLDGRGLNLGNELEDRVAILRACPTGDTWALRDLDRALAALARRWLPDMFDFLRDMYAIGDTARAERAFIYFAGLISTHGATP